MCKRKRTNRYLIAVSRGGKVVELNYSKDLSDLRAIRLHHMVELRHPDSEFAVLRLSDSSIGDDFQPSFSRNGKPSNRVKCLENNEVFESISVCSRAMNIPERSIRESMRRGIMAYGYHFVMLPPLRRFD